MQSQTDLLYLPLDHIHKDLSEKHGVTLMFAAHYIDFRKGNLIIRVGTQHFRYAKDIIRSFDYYFGAVECNSFMDHNIVDYSSPKFHDVIGYSRHPVYFSSFSEPLITTHQYLTFANLKPGDNVLDLGAYSALTSIMFKDLVEESGRVIAVDADEKNIKAIYKNRDLYERMTGRHIEVLDLAVWNRDGSLEFSCEGNMGSSAMSIVGPNRGLPKAVTAAKLSTIAASLGIDRIDFIKCDIEGAEGVVFEDTEFFSRFSPRIMIEPHYVSGTLTAAKCIADLSTHGYVCRSITQSGVHIPLIECTPPVS